MRRDEAMLATDEDSVARHVRQVRGDIYWIKGVCRRCESLQGVDVHFGISVHDHSFPRNSVTWEFPPPRGTVAKPDGSSWEANLFPGWEKDCRAATARLRAALRKTIGPLLLQSSSRHSRHEHRHSRFR